MSNTAYLLVVFIVLYINAKVELHKEKKEVERLFKLGNDLWYEKTYGKKEDNI